MGEHICEYCEYMNGHLYVHEFNECEACDRELLGFICNSCNVPFEMPSKELLNVMKALKRGDISL